MSQFSTSENHIIYNQAIAKYLSCDNLEDAIRSLALVYDVEERRISRVFYEDWPEFLPKYVEAEFFKDDRLAWCMAQHLRCADINESILHSAHYHRGLFNGDKNWFECGLLNSEDGASAFLEHIRPKLSLICDFEKIKKIALSNIRDRTNCEPQFGGGPYAFDRLEDAKNAQRPGLDYSVPEFFMGNVWDLYRADPCNASVLRQICSDSFLPVIVKFVAENSRIRRYVNNLWHYLYVKKFQIELEPNCYTFAGCGRTIPQRQIMELIF